MKESVPSSICPSSSQGCSRGSLVSSQATTRSFARLTELRSQKCFMRVHDAEFSCCAVSLTLSVFTFCDCHVWSWRKYSRSVIKDLLV
ncbi:Xanthine dehydrogenase 2 [Frankliniella fusca]|uniref:Xanthine dehydrogenase 2 n=1 Tax=Frankliniella fusca TaxID=407009 RepID=A0AAE1GXQ3_9NEOP|nr:Xanthine dehydrogenase 2 [Frankliniella fusca]